jgi:GNAT superfamily N-acetyltransferase
MSTPVQFRDLRTEADRGLIEAIYHDILQPSFTADELDPLDYVLDGLSENGSYECWGLGLLDGETPVGCILGYPYRASGVLLIGYLATKPGVRSRGVGTLLLGEARWRWYGRSGRTLVLAEIDDPRFHPPAGDIDPERRVAFYARQKTQMVIGPYFQPRVLGEGRKRVHGMFLAVLHGGDGASVPAPQLAAFLQEYFADVEQESGWPRPEDAEGRWLLDWYRDRETVALRPIDEYAKTEIPRGPGGCRLYGPVIRPSNTAGSGAMKVRASRPGSG